MAALIFSSDPVQNMNTLDSALSNMGDQVLPPGVIYCRATPSKRYATIQKSGILRSSANTILKLVSDQGGPGFDDANYELGLIRVAPVSLELEIKGLTLDIEGFNADKYPQSPQGPVDNAPPEAFVVQGAESSNLKRIIKWDGCRIRGAWNGGITLAPADLNRFPGISGFRTELHLTNADIETSGMGITSRGDNVFTSKNLKLLTGHRYANGDGYGNCYYGDQGTTVRVEGFDITHRFGRDCFKDAGTRSEGGGGYSYLSRGTVRSLRPGFGTGVGIDKWRPLNLDRVKFENLSSAVTHWGGFEMEHCIVENCRKLLSQTGSGSSPDGPQIIRVASTFLRGCHTILDKGVQHGRYHFEDLDIDGINNDRAIPFSLSDPWGDTCAVDLLDSRINVEKAMQVFGFDFGRWRVKGDRIAANTSRGIFGFGASPGTSVLVAGGSLTGEKWYHSIQPENRTRVRIQD